MKPEARAFLDKSRECLEKADGMLARWPDEAGRTAYLAGLHAARAFIVEKTGQLAKTRVQRELGRLTKDERVRNPAHFWGVPTISRQLPITKPGPVRKSRTRRQKRRLTRLTASLRRSAS